ncbi:hypothetical protein A3Q41_05054 (plasmid) [Rhodococcoides fascians]|uniref:Uncharacterized protein n=1 Tax=Rhodococcoides fascians TaxID=1828 RepID=A0A143QTJ6_RHOFA|nr:hypothetical protein A3Q41_05054 [Rhodococcus fascians]
MSTQSQVRSQAGSPRGRFRTRSYASLTRCVGYPSASAIWRAAGALNLLCPALKRPDVLATDADFAREHPLGQPPGYSQITEVFLVLRH